jgi:hypothetical protein
LFFCVCLCVCWVVKRGTNLLMKYMLIARPKVLNRFFCEMLCLLCLCGLLIPVWLTIFVSDHPVVQSCCSRLASFLCVPVLKDAATAVMSRTMSLSLCCSVLKRLLSVFYSALFPPEFQPLVALVRGNCHDRILS